MGVVFYEFGLDDGEVGVDNGSSGCRFLTLKQHQSVKEKKILLWVMSEKR